MVIILASGPQIGYQVIWCSSPFLPNWMQKGRSTSLIWWHALKEFGARIMIWSQICFSRMMWKEFYQFPLCHLLTQISLFGCRIMMGSFLLKRVLVSISTLRSSRGSYKLFYPILKSFLEAFWETTFTSWSCNIGLANIKRSITNKFQFIQKGYYRWSMFSIMHKNSFSYIIYNCQLIGNV